MTSSQVYSVSDPRLDIREKLDLVLEGADNVSFQQFQPNQVSDASVQITCDPPNRSIGIGRCPEVNANYTVQINFTNTSGGEPLPDTSYWGIRRNAYTQTVSSHQISMNNDVFAISPVNQYDRALAHYYENYNDRFTSMSTTGSKLDQYQNYHDGANQNNNPLALYGSDPYDQCRNDSNINDGNGVLISNLTGNTAGSTQVNFNVSVTEPLMYLSPLSQGVNGYYNNCIFLTDKMTYSSTFSNLARILSIDTESLPAGVAITSVVVHVAQNGINLRFNYLKPKEKMFIPKQIDYPYYSMVLYTTNMASTVSGANVTAVSNNIQLVGIPRKIYLWASQPNSVYESNSTTIVGPNTYAPNAWSTSDAFMRLNSIQVTWNTNNYLASATPTDLYNISVKNGCRLSWVQWYGAMGSVLCLDTAEDIGLTSSEASGVNKTIQLAITANYTNVNQSLTWANPVFNILVCYDGVMHIKDGFTSREINTLSEQDVLSAVRSQNITYNDIQSLYGGSFLGDLWSGVKRVANYLKPALTPVLDVAQNFVPYGQHIRKGIRAVTGYGAQTGGAQTGGYVMTGGKGHMSRAQMMKNMREYSDM